MAAANNDVRCAKYGIVCVYGVESLFSPKFFSVQEEFGRIVDGANFELTTNDLSLSAKNVALDTTNMLFVLEGTISNERQHAESAGSRIHHQNRNEWRAGIVPRLRDKFPVITFTKALSNKHLRRILTGRDSSPVGQYKRRFAEVRIDLGFEEDALEEIVREVVRIGNGARGIMHILGEVLDDRFYSARSEKELLVNRGMVLKALKNMAYGSETEETETSTI